MEDIRKKLADQLMSAIKNKSGIVEQIFKILEEQNKIESGLDNFINAIDGDNVGDKMQLKMIKTLCRSMKSQANAIRQLSMSSLVYICDGDFTGDAGKMIMHMDSSKGKDVIQEIFKQKLKGR